MPEAIVALGERKIPVGRLLFENDGRRQHSTFLYNEDWLTNPGAFDLAPGYERGTAPLFASGREDKRDAIGGPFSDAAPDSWGRRLIARSLGEGLTEFEFLVYADDRTRQGALRFLDANMEPLSRMHDPVPRRVDIEEIRRIAAQYERDPMGAEKEARILAGVGGSLGGARPKASVIDGEDLWIAKFTSINDGRPVERVEVATLTLARSVGIRTPEAHLEFAASEHPVALVRRFDRRNGGRVPYISVRTALQETGANGRYYTDIVDVIRRISVDAEADMRELWRRMAFTILVSNTDDHLKNHGFLYVRNNFWRLSPAFDINPQPNRAPHMETGISPLSGFEPSIDAAVKAAPFFEIDGEEAKTMTREMAEAISARWRPALRNEGLRGAELNGFAPAFEHREMEVALRL